MIDRIGVATIQCKRGSDGRLGPHIDGFAAFLVREGYAPQTVRGKCEL